MAKNKALSIVGIVVVAVLLVGGGVIGGKMMSNSGSSSSKSTVGTSNTESSSTKPSTDKYTWYIKNYVGRNASDACAQSFTDDYGCSDSYGSAWIDIKFITEDGLKITEANIRDYVVVGQDIKPDTQLDLEFRKDEAGQEYEGLVANQNISEIVLDVKEVE